MLDSVWCKTTEKVPYDGQKCLGYISRYSDFNLFRSVEELAILVFNEADSCWHEPSHEFGYRCSLEDVVLWQPIVEADNDVLEGVLK